MDEKKRMIEDKVSHLIMIFAVPGVISLVLNALYNMVDQIFIGRGVGYLGNGATNVIFPLTQFAVAFGLLIGDGTAAYFNLKQGEGKHGDAEKGMNAGVFGSLLTGIVISIVFCIFMKPLCTLFGATDKILPYALDYGYIICAGMVFCVFATATMSMIRADGAPKFAMAGLIAGCVTNLIGDPLLIFVFHMGVKGAAIATIAGQLVNCAFNVWYLAHMKSVQLKWKAAFASLKYLKKVCSYGLSSFATQIACVIVMAVQNNLLVQYGAMSAYGAEIPMTALGVTMKVFTLLQNAVTGLCSGSQPVISYNYGCGRRDRVLEALRIILGVSVALMAAATIWFQLAPMSIVNIFGSADALYNDFSVKCLRIYLALLVLDAVQMTASSFFQSIGQSKKAAFLILLRQIVVLIPAMLICAHFFGVVGILYAGPIASLVTGVISAVLLRKEVHEEHQAMHLKTA